MTVGKMWPCYRVLKWFDVLNGIFILLKSSSICAHLTLFNVKNFFQKYVFSRYSKIFIGLLKIPIGFCPLCNFTLDLYNLCLYFATLIGLYQHFAFVNIVIFYEPYNSEIFPHVGNLLCKFASRIDIVSTAICPAPPDKLSCHVSWPFSAL